MRKKISSILAIAIFLAAFNGCAPQKLPPENIAFSGLQKATATYQAAHDLANIWKDSLTRQGLFGHDQAVWWNTKLLPADQQVHDALATWKGGLKIYVGSKDPDAKAALDKIVNDAWALIFTLQKLATQPGK